MSDQVVSFTPSCYCNIVSMSTWLYITFICVFENAATDQNSETFRILKMAHKDEWLHYWRHTFPLSVCCSLTGGTKEPLVPSQSELMPSEQKAMAGSGCVYKTIIKRIMRPTIYTELVRNGLNMTSWMWPVLTGKKPKSSQCVALVSNAVEGKLLDKSRGFPPIILQHKVVVFNELLKLWGSQNCSWHLLAVLCESVHKAGRINCKCWTKTLQNWSQLSKRPLTEDFLFSVWRPPLTLHSYGFHKRARRGSTSSATTTCCIYSPLI